ncbi:MAG TPA: hypothetical protein VGM37_19175 [Armatimonadota bacterium]|jgi:hypothetical protein
MHYRIVVNIRHVGDIEDGRFTTHLKGMDAFAAYFDKWKDNPVSMGDHEEPMDWGDPIKVWYKLMGDMPHQTVLRAIPKDPPPAGLPPGAPGL